MHRSSFLALALTVLLVGLVGLTVAPLAERAGSPPEWPGSKGRGVTLLPNGWKIAPAGRSFHVGDFPLSMVQSPDGRYVIVSNNGWSRPTLTTVDVVQGFVKSRLPVDHAWLGLAWSPDGKQLYSSGAANNTVNTFAYANGDLKASGSIVLERPSIQFPAGTRELGGTGFIGGVAINADGSRLYAVHVLGRGISRVDLKGDDPLRTVSLPAEPYTALLSRDGSTLFVSLWSGAKVLALDPETLACKAPSPSSTCRRPMR